MGVSVRKASADDSEALFGLVTAFATSFAPQPDAFQECLTQLLADQSAWLSVAEKNGATVGYCLGFDHFAFYANGRVSWVEEIMVTEQLRGEGIGRMLLQAFEDWSRERGSKLVGLATRRAAPFYSALGYEESAAFFRKILLD